MPAEQGTGNAIRRPRMAGALALIVAVLAAVPCLAQPSPDTGVDLPLSVETIGLEPTVGKTGDIVTATYRVRFRDLASEGKEVLVLEDRMAADKLPIAPFEAVGLGVAKRQVGNLSVWDFVYRLRIVAQKKGPVVLPSITFYWLVRDIGQDLEDVPVRQAVTQPLQFRYVSTITDDDVLELRDEIELGSFAGRAALFRTIGWIVAPLPLAIWLIAAGLALRRPRKAAIKRPVPAEAEPELVLPESPTLRQARRHLRSQLRALGNGASPHGADATADAAVTLALREYLTAELPALNPGDTARDIRRHVQTKVAPGSRKNTLDALAARLIAYQDGLERGMPVFSAAPREEEQEIESLLAQLNVQARLADRVRRVLTRS
jgi:hypothetical protein